MEDYGCYGECSSQVVVAVAVQGRHLRCLGVFGIDDEDQESLEVAVAVEVWMDLKGSFIPSLPLLLLPLAAAVAVIIILSLGVFHFNTNSSSSTTIHLNLHRCLEDLPGCRKCLSGAPSSILLPLKRRMSGVEQPDFLINEDLCCCCACCAL